MTRQKLISVLQSRIAKRRNYLAGGWELFDELKRDDYTEHEAYYFIVTLINVGKEQKEDKQILKQLIRDARCKQHYVEVVYDMNKELQVLRRELARYKYSVDGFGGV